MTGYEDYNYPAFRRAAKQLQDEGYLVEDPSTIQIVDIVVPTWTDYMRATIPMMLKCEGVATLDGWNKSRGASLEVLIANWLNMPVHPLGVWLEVIRNG